MASPAIYVLAQYRFRDNVPDPAGLNVAFDAGDAAQNSGATLSIDTLYRLRVSVDQVDPNARDSVSMKTVFLLQYNLAGGGWNDLGGETDLLEAVESDTSLQFTDGAATTELLTNNFVYLAGNGSNDNTTSVVTFLDDKTMSCEFEFAFRINGSVVSDAQEIQFRLLYDDDGGGTGTPDSVVSHTAMPMAIVDKTGQTLAPTSALDAAPSFGVCEIEVGLETTVFDGSPSFGSYVLTVAGAAATLTQASTPSFSPTFGTTGVALGLAHTVFDASPAFGTNEVVGTPTMVPASVFDASPAFGSHSISLDLEAPGPVATTMFGSHTSISAEQTLTQTATPDFSVTFGESVIANGDILIATILEIDPFLDGDDAIIHVLEGGYEDTYDTAASLDRPFPGGQPPKHQTDRSIELVSARQMRLREEELVRRDSPNLPRTAAEGTIMIYHDGKWTGLPNTAPDGYVLTLVSGRPRWAP